MKRNLLLVTILISLYAFSQSINGTSIPSRAKELQDSYVAVGNVSSSKASVAEILDNPRLVVLPQQKDPKEAIHLHSFVMTITSKGQKQAFETTYGYRFTNDQIAAIKNLQSGDIINIDGINGKKLSENLRNFPSIKLTIQ